MKALVNTMIKKIGICASMLLLAGCASTTITEYDKDGKVVSVTETDADMMSILAQGAKNKDNFVSLQGWVIGVNPTANVYGAGSFSGVMGSINKEFGAVNASSYSTMINEAKVKLDLTADKDGIKAKVDAEEDKKEEQK